MRVSHEREYGFTLTNTGYFQTVSYTLIQVGHREIIVGVGCRYCVIREGMARESK